MVRGGAATQIAGLEMAAIRALRPSLLDISGPLVCLVELDSRADALAAAAAALALLRYQTHGPGGLLSKAGTFPILASTSSS
ncbi:hypothetical protein JYU34_000478 [Plutella xylostella]|uniref:Uncharacterized protein n=1 Tax=Plutella xylostella TaxID=51655 RepID=A0ABQ7R812_PLUXY|nr:hypothetical protein JYU34_000478 [Plutella xylostella]